MENNVITTEEIHAKLDAYSDKLMSISTPIDSKAINKDQNLKSLGFKKVKTQGLETKEKIVVNYLAYLKATYPLEKFVTLKDFKKLLKKYDLSTSHVSSYVKDVPEKNVSEMKNAKPLKEEDKISCLQAQVWNISVFNKKGNIKHYLAKDMVYNPNFDEEHRILTTENHAHTYAYESLIAKMDKDIIKKFLKAKPKLKVSDIRDVSWRTGRERVDIDGFYIAAPSNHFEKGFFNMHPKFLEFTGVEKVLKDPIVYQYCQHGIIRIITKWGTDDDQSYLDPIVSNPTLLN